MYDGGIIATYQKENYFFNLLQVKSKKMANDKYNIEIELKAKLQEADSLIKKTRDVITSLVF